MDANEKVGVKYSDGTIIENVHYKEVKEDIENGRCKVI